MVRVLGADSESGPGGGKYRVPDVNQSSSTRTGKVFLSFLEDILFRYVCVFFFQNYGSLEKSIWCWFLAPLVGSDLPNFRNFQPFFHLTSVVYGWEALCSGPMKNLVFITACDLPSNRDHSFYHLHKMVFDTLFLKTY